MTWNDDGWGFIDADIMREIDNFPRFLMEHTEVVAEDIYDWNEGSWVYELDEQDEIIPGSLHLVTYEEILNRITLSIEYIFFGEVINV